DGHSGADSSAARIGGKQGANQATGIGADLTQAGNGTTMEEHVMTRISLPLLLGSSIALGLAAQASAAEELRIGLIIPATGPFAQVGKDMVDGLNMYLEEMKSDFAGAKVKLIVEDSQAKPDTAVTRAKKLTLQDKVHILLGGVLATEGYAI